MCAVFSKRYKKTFSLNVENYIHSRLVIATLRAFRIGITVSELSQFEY